MSVEPGKGEQEFMDGSVFKISELALYRDEDNCHYLIEVDVGINDESYSFC